MEEKNREMNTKVSVIVPLYNKKEYLQLTVDSILNQTLADIEVLIIDDCSTDGSLELCREVYGHDERVRIIQQPHNMGPGAARNKGINESRGKYIVFVDGDDEILPDRSRKMFETAEKYNADIVHNTEFLFPVPDENGNIPLELVDGSVKLFPISGNMNGDDYKKITPLSDDMSSRLEDWKNRRINWSVCSKMFRRDFLVDNSIYLSDMKFGEDMVFCFECLFKAKCYVMMPGGDYVYRVIASSLSRAKKSSAKIVTALQSQIAAVSTMSRVLKEIPFFVQNPQESVYALERVLDDIEGGYIRPAYQELGEEALRSDNLIHQFMQSEFGDKAPYVEFLFYELHNNYEPVVDYLGLLSDVENLKALAKSFGEKEKGNK